MVSSEVSMKIATLNLKTLQAFDGRSPRFLLQGIQKLIVKLFGSLL